MASDKCMKCDKPATHKITKIIKGQVHDILLCNEHAETHSPYLQGKKADQSKLLKLLQDFLKQQENVMVDAGGREGVSEEGPECSNCGLTYGAYRKTLLLGCSDCYDSFGGLLLNDLRKMHGAISQNTDHFPSSPPLPPLPGVQAGEEAASLPPFEKESTGGGKPASSEETIQSLEKRLQDAIEKEDFKLAVKLRDAIQKRQEEAGK